MAISDGGTSLATSISRTEPCASASTTAACGNVTERSSGLRWKRSETSTMLTSRFGSRNVRRLSGVAKAARLIASELQNPSSSRRASNCSRTPSATPRSSSWRTASAPRFLNSIRAASASCGSGLVGM